MNFRPCLYYARQSALCNVMRYTFVYREFDMRLSVYSVSTYRGDETGSINLRISSDTQFINNIKIYQFYPL